MIKLSQFKGTGKVNRLPLELRYIFIPKLVHLSVLKDCDGSRDSAFLKEVDFGLRLRFV